MENLWEFTYKILLYLNKAYLCSYELKRVHAYAQKVLKAVQQQELQIKSKEVNGQLVESCNLIQEIKPIDLRLLRIIWLHGTNLAIWPNLKQTAMQFIPTGRLSKLGVVPMSGELQEGTLVRGVNQYGLSGVSIAYFYRAINYAGNPNFQLNIQKYREDVEAFLSYYTKKIEKAAADEVGDGRCIVRGQDTFESRWVIKIAHSLRRLKMLDIDFFQKNRAQLAEVIVRLQADFKVYKLSEDYMKHMPKEEDPNGIKGFTHHDYYYAKHFQQFEFALDACSKALSETIIIPKDIEMASTYSSIPLVFGATSIRTEPYFLSPVSTNIPEYTSIGAVTLGKDIQVAFTPSEHQKEIAQLFETSGLKGKVSIFPIKQLGRIEALNRIVFPYFADIMSFE